MVLLGGIKLSETATLAEHHYTASLMGWFVSQKIKSSGGKINERKIVLMLMIHDLGELFGGDISTPLNRKYPELREYKDKIGNKTISLLSGFLDDSSEITFKKLWKMLF